MGHTAKEGSMRHTPLSDITWRGTLRRALLAVLGAGLLGFAVTAAGAPVDQAMAELKRLEPVPDQIHAIYDRVEKQRVLAYKDDVAIDKSLTKYSQNLRRTFERIAKLSEEEAKSEGKKSAGAHKALARLEDMAKVHEKRVAALEDRAKKLDTLIRNGDVRLDEEMLKRMSKEDREEFLKYVSEPIQKEYLDQYKQLFAAWVTRFADLVSTDAQASAISPCIPMCNPASWPACAVCVAAFGGITAVYKWNDLMSNLATCDKIRWTWVRRGCKAGAIALYVYYIA
jgi:hypothetical protein